MAIENAGMQQRRDTAANWTTLNPVLLIGEIGLEIDTKPYKVKIGDGVTAWSSLAYELTGGESEYSFTGLTDTPDSYTGQAGKLVKINTGETAVEFDDLALSELSDCGITTPSDGQVLTWNGTAWQAEAIPDATIAGIRWVSTAGNDSNSGTQTSPYRTVQHALDSYASMIFVGHGVFSENITVPTGYGNYGPVMWAYNVHDSQKTELVGTFTIPAGVSRMRAYGIQFDGNTTVPCLIDNGSEGRHYWHNCTFNNSGSADCVQINNGKRWHEFIGSVIDGKLNLAGTGSSCAVNLKHTTGSTACVATVNTGYTLSLLYVERMGLITHHSSNIAAEYVASWTPTGGYIITSDSTSYTNVIAVAYSNFTANGLTYGTINSIGATVLTGYNLQSPYSDICLSAISVSDTTIPIAGAILIATTKTVERNVAYNTSTGVITFSQTGSYHISAIIKINCTELDKVLELWIEKYNTSTSTWDAVANTGLVRNFQTDQEVEVGYEFSTYITAGDQYRLAAKSDSDTAIIAQTQTLSNSIKMPTIRLSVYA